MERGGKIMNAGLRPAWPALVFLLVALVMLGADALNGSAVHDIDDIARRLQIADLLQDGNWHDPDWPFLSMPDPYASPWSRLVDLPYVLITWALEPVLGPQAAFAAARFVVPLLWLIAYAGLAAQLIRHILGDHPGLPAMAAAAFASLFAVIEFMPDRVDHHNVQIVLLLAACLGIVSRHRHAGILLGLASVLSIAVGLECVPYIALALSGVAVNAAFAPQSGMPRKLLLCGLTLLAATLPAGLLLSGPTLFQTHCDALSAPWALALMAGGLVAAGAPPVWSLFNLTHPVPRLGILVFGGGLALAALWLTFPECHAGPYGMINETARTFWISNVIQEKGPVGAFARGEHLLVAIFLTLLAMTLAAWMSPPARRAPVLILLLMATLGTLLSAWQMRNFKFPAALLPLFLPLFLARARAGNGVRLGLSVLVPPALLLAGFAGLVKPESRTLSLVDYMEGDACRDADLTSLSDLPPSRIMAPMGLSLTLARHISETGSGHSVAALPFHRAAPGMKRMFETFLLSDPSQRRDALAPFDLLAVCTLPDTGNAPDQAPLFAALSSGRDWPGLQEIPQDPESRFRLFRIDHDTVE